MTELSAEARQVVGSFKELQDDGAEQAVVDEIHAANPEPTRSV